MNYRQPSYTSRRDLLKRFVGGLAEVGATAALWRCGFAVANAEPLSTPITGLADCGRFAAGDVIDGDTLNLADGSTLRLCGIEAPKDALANGDPDVLNLAKQARAALAKLTVGRALRLYCDQAPFDRHRRRMAQVLGADGLWLQAEMLKLGLARVHGQADHRLGLREMLAVEADARRTGIGLWGAPAFALRRADDPDLGRFAGSFQIIAGRPLTAERKNDLGFVNFGPDRHADLTLVLKNEALKLSDAANIAIEGLSGRDIRCRGWLGLRDGPNIEITHPEQIEILES